MNLSDTDLAAMKEREAAATPGPWSVVHVGNIHYGVGSAEWPNQPSVVYAHAGRDGYGNGSRKVNAEFIAHARMDVPRLLAEVEALRAENERLNDVIARMDREVEKHISLYVDALERNNGLLALLDPDNPEAVEKITVESYKMCVANGSFALVQPAVQTVWRRRTRAILAALRDAAKEGE